MSELIIGAQVGSVAARKVLVRSFLSASADNGFADVSDELVDAIVSLMLDAWVRDVSNQTVSTIIADSGANLCVGYFANIKSIAQVKVIVLEIGEDTVLLPLISDVFSAEPNDPICEGVVESWGVILAGLNDIAWSFTPPVIWAQDGVLSQSKRIVAAASRGYWHIASPTQ